MITIDREELFALLENSDWGEQRPWSHGYRETSHVIRDGKHYIVTYDVHPDDGIQDYGGFELVPAKSVTSVRWLKA